LLPVRRETQISAMFGRTGHAAARYWALTVTLAIATLTNAENTLRLQSDSFGYCFGGYGPGAGQQLDEAIDRMAKQTKKLMATS